MDDFRQLVKEDVFLTLLSDCRRLTDTCCKLLDKFCHLLAETIPIVAEIIKKICHKVTERNF